MPLEKAVGGFIKAGKMDEAMDVMKKQAVLFQQIAEQNNIDKVGAQLFLFWFVLFLVGAAYVILDLP